MKKQRKEPGLLCKGILLLILGSTVFTLSGQSLDTTIVRSMPVKINDEIYVHNFMDDITVKTWTKQEIRVEYAISVRAETETKIRSFTEQLISQIDDRFKTNNSGKLDVSFPFASVSGNNKVWEITFRNSSDRYELRDLKHSLVIYMPETNALNAKSSFHKLTIDNLKANASISISSTTFKMGDCKDLELKASFSKGMQIGNVENANLNISSSDLETGAISGNLTLKSSFSTIETNKIANNATLKLNSSSFQTTDIGNLDLTGSFIRDFKAGQIEKATININSSSLEANRINSLDIGKVSFSHFKIHAADILKLGNSASSDFAFDQINTIESDNCSFTTFTVENLKTRFITKASSGSIQIKNAMPGFDKISIEGSFVTTDIHADPASNFLLTADMTFPNYHFDNMQYTRRDQDMNHQIIDGWKGNKDTAKSSIHLNCQSCKITVD